MSLEVGDRVRARVGPVAHGGHFVARVPSGGDGREVVVFVRHALPGELVTIAITEVSRSFLRGDAVEILEAAADRVEPPCPLAHPDGCGGCDFQHVALPAQRVLKAAVVAEQLHRLAGIDRAVLVEAVPGDESGLRWRTRMQYVGLAEGRKGLRKYRSHDVVPVEDCLIAAPDAHNKVTGEATRRASGPQPAVIRSVLGHEFQVAADGFWQVHPGAPTALVETVTGMLGAGPGDRALDLYAGVGLFSVFLAEAVGPQGRVLAVEGDRRAAQDAAANLAGFPHAEVARGQVERVLDRRLGGEEDRADLVVLDPPRAGAKRNAVEAVARLRPRAIAYVACDPAALARDLGLFAERGYALAELRAFDLFPMTHHVECVALLTKTGSDLR